MNADKTKKAPDLASTVMSGFHTKNFIFINTAVEKQTSKEGGGKNNFMSICLIKTLSPRQNHLHSDNSHSKINRERQQGITFK